MTLNVIIILFFEAKLLSFIYIRQKRGNIDFESALLVVKKLPESQ